MLIRRSIDNLQNAKPNSESHIPERVQSRCHAMVEPRFVGHTAVASPLRGGGAKPRPTPRDMSGDQSVAGRTAAQCVHLDIGTISAGHTLHSTPYGRLLGDSRPVGINSCRLGVASAPACDGVDSLTPPGGQDRQTGPELRNLAIETHPKTPTARHPTPGALT